MSKITRSPGPWYVDYYNGNTAVFDKNERIVCQFEDGDQWSRGEGRADATLIAAAPAAIEFVEFVTKVSNGAASPQEIISMGAKAYEWLARVNGDDHE
jgi:hypothetical protein